MTSRWFRAPLRFGIDARIAAAGTDGLVVALALAAEANQAGGDERHVPRDRAGVEQLRLALGGLRLSATRIERALADLQAAGLIERAHDGAIDLSGWGDLVGQRLSDAERSKRYRARRHERDARDDEGGESRGERDARDGEGRTSRGERDAAADKIRREVDQTDRQRARARDPNPTAAARADRPVDRRNGITKTDFEREAARLCEAARGREVEP